MYAHTNSRTRVRSCLSKINLQQQNRCCECVMYTRSRGPFLRYVVLFFIFILMPVIHVHYPAGNLQIAISAFPTHRAPVSVCATVAQYAAYIHITREKQFVQLTRNLAHDLTASVSNYCPGKWSLVCGRPRLAFYNSNEAVRDGVSIIGKRAQRGVTMHSSYIAPELHIVTEQKRKSSKGRYMEIVLVSECYYSLVTENCCCIGCKITGDIFFLKVTPKQQKQQ